MDALHRMVESGHVPHALLLHEDDGGGAFPIVLNFLEELYGFLLFGLQEEEKLREIQKKRDQQDDDDPDDAGGAFSALGFLNGFGLFRHF